MIAETPFINGKTLSYPIGYFPQLFAVVNARTKKGFVAGLMAMEDENKGGEGIPENTLIEMIRVGLLHDNPTITTAETTELVQDYLVIYGHKELDKKIVDAFVDSGLYDRKTVEKQRAFAEQIEQISEEREIALIKKAQAELNRLNSAIDVLIDSAIQESLISSSEIPGKDDGSESNDDDDFMSGDEYEHEGYYGDDKEYVDPGEPMVKTYPIAGNNGADNPNTQGQASGMNNSPNNSYDRGQRPNQSSAFGGADMPMQGGATSKQPATIYRRRRPRPGSSPLEPPEINQRI